MGQHETRHYRVNPGRDHGGAFLDSAPSDCRANLRYDTGDGMTFRDYALAVALGVMFATFFYLGV